MNRPTTSHHYILDSLHMWKLYEEAKGQEAYTIHFWNPRLNQDFTLRDGWLVAPEQFVHTDLRNGYERMDTYVEWFDAHQYLHVGVMLHEAKREGQNVRDLESQALGYARSDISERSLQRLFVITTLGTAFRLWTVENGADAGLLPHFGPATPGLKKAYIDAASPDASYYYKNFVDAIKAIPKLLRAPIVPSQRHLLPTLQAALPGQDTAGPSSVTEASPGGSNDATEPPSSGIKEEIVWVELRPSESPGESSFHYLGKDRRTSQSSWKRDKTLNAMIFRSKTFGKTFGWRGSH
ncbi:hypothetical protein MY1884_009267 [Beauveria asiatica]